MTVVFYDALHVIGAMMLFTGLGGLAALAMSGNATHKARVVFVALHGLGLGILLVAGFGAMAKLGMGSSFPLWIIIKIVLWLFLGASLTLFKRKAELGRVLVFVVLAAGLLAAFLGNYKPFQ